MQRVESLCGKEDLRSWAMVSRVASAPRRARSTHDGLGREDLLDLVTDDHMRGPRGVPLGVDGLPGQGGCVVLGEGATEGLDGVEIDRRERCLLYTSDAADE